MREKLRTLIGGIESTVGPKLPETDDVPPPFFGRGPELAILRRAIGSVRSEGECRAVTLVGPTGIGKSRLIEEFAREVRQLDDPPVRIFRSSAPRNGSSWSSFTQILAQRFEIVEAADLDEAKSSVRTQVVGVLDDRKVGDVLYLLGDLLDLEFPKSPLTKAFEEGAPETEMLKRAILKSFVEADAAFGPMCFVFDDLHLCHEHTLSMLRFLIEHLKAPVLFLCAARPEIFARHGALPAVAAHATVQLEALAELDSAALIGSVLTPDGMTPMHLVEQARAVTGGNPGRIEEAGRFYRDRGTLPPPPTGADAALETRIEGLAADERVILQKAAVMGGVFWLGGLIVLDRDGREPPEMWSPKEEPGLAELSNCLARLSERDYILRLPDSTFPYDEEYVFRHRAERERIAALTSPTDARKWHRLLADWLDSQPETRSHEEYLELLADQREKAGAHESAAGAFLEAAGQSRAHGSPKRELGYYEKALALLEDGHSRRLTALLRASELLEQLQKPEAALDRYREAAGLAFRVNRRRLWETAHLAMTRLRDKLAAIEEAKQAELDAILVADAKRRADLADQAAAAASTAQAAPPPEPPPAPEPPPPPEPSPASEPAPPPEALAAEPPAPEKSEVVEPAAETTRSGEPSSGPDDVAAAAAPDEPDDPESELEEALSAPAEVLAGADDDRWDSPPADEAPTDVPQLDEPQAAAAETDDAGAPDDAREAPEETASAASGVDQPADDEATEEDGPAGDQPTMLSAADIEPAHDPTPPPVVVVAAADPTTEKAPAGADATEPPAPEARADDAREPEPKKPIDEPNDEHAPAATGTETGT